MSPTTEIRILVGRELRRALRSTKGIAIGVLTLLGAFVAALACVQIERTDRLAAEATSTATYVEAKRAVLEHAYGDAALAAYIASVPSSLLVFLKITVWFLPLLVALLGFDAVTGDLQNRSVRFWTVRVRRSSFLVGKFLGLWCLVSLVTFVIDLVADVVAITRGYVTFGEAVGWGLRFWLVAVVIAAAWASIATFVSASYRTPMLSLLTTFAVFFVLWLFGLGGFLARVRDTVAGGVGTMARGMSWYEYLYPNAYDTMLVSPSGEKAAIAVAILAGFSAALTAAGAVLFARRDL